MNSKTEDHWTGIEGKKYTDRNILNSIALNQLYLDNYGISRTKLNDMFLSDTQLTFDSKILEVGCNVGNQLNILSIKRNYQNLYGIELQDYALNIAKSYNHFTTMKGNANDIPFKDNFFEMVFTSGLLIHIPPDEINKVLDEIYRCSSKYIWGFEYFDHTYQQIEYRDKSNIMWKGNFMKMFTDRFPDLKVIKYRLWPYMDNDNLDIMYLLSK